MEIQALPACRSFRACVKQLGVGFSLQGVGVNGNVTAVFVGFMVKPVAAVDGFGSRLLLWCLLSKARAFVLGILLQALGPFPQNRGPLATPSRPAIITVTPIWGFSIPVPVHSALFLRSEKSPSPRCRTMLSGFRPLWQAAPQHPKCVLTELSSSGFNLGCSAPNPVVTARESRHGGLRFQNFRIFAFCSR